MPADLRHHLRQHLISIARRMVDADLNKVTSGNLSVRAEEDGESGFLITPTSLPYDTLMPEDLVFMRMDGSFTGERQPSSEWRFHRDIYLARPEAGAILHAHSPFATSLACLRREIPPFHYMIARFGGNTLRCAKYATFGTQALSDAALLAMQDRQACLLANHGMLVFGRDLDLSLDLAIELEALCEQYWRASLMGNPVLLDEAEMAVVLGKFSGYGQQGKSA